MKSFFLYVIFLAISYTCLAQNDSTIFIIENAIRSRKDVNRILYLSRSFGYDQPLSSLAKNGKIFGRKDTIKTFIKLSRVEIKVLDSAFKNTKSLLWSQNMFENSFMISDDSLSTLYIEGKGNIHFENQIIKKYFYFSKPIFLRNNSIAIFRLAEMYGPSAGNDLLYIYQKTNGEWQQYMFKYMGAW